MAITITGFNGGGNGQAPQSAILSDGRTIPYSQLQGYQQSRPDAVQNLSVGTDISSLITPSPQPNVTPTNTNTPQTVDNVMAGQVNNPTLPQGAEFQPTLMGSSEQSLTNRGELLTGQGAALNPATGGVPQQTGITAPTATATAAQASTVDPNGIPQVQAGNYQATQIGANAAQGTAAQGTLSAESTVQGQLASLYAQSADGQIPSWAQGAMRLANDVMAARGLGASSIGAKAITAAVQESAFNIAAKDAASYFQMDIANLSNRQQMSLENVRNRQQALLSDQAADNAAKQFNAASDQQVSEFMTQLVAQIQSQNADRTQAISQFNASEINKISTQNAQFSLTAQQFNQEQLRSINEFNATLTHQREMFNAQTQFAIEQSNVLWRRNINTANTAAINAANQANTQNKFNLSSTALNNIWQQFRDEAQWMFTASENDKTRAFNAAQAANNRQYASSQQPNQLASAVGAFAGSLLF